MSTHLNTRRIDDDSLMAMDAFVSHCFEKRRDVDNLRWRERYLRAAVYGAMELGAAAGVEHKADEDAVELNPVVILLKAVAPEDARAQLNEVIWPWLDYYGNHYD